MHLQTAMAIWILVSGSALAQVPQSGVWMGIGPVSGAAATQNKPFSADLVVTTDRQAEGAAAFHQEMQGKVARNSPGLTYMDMTIPSPLAGVNKGSRITITNPSEHTFVSLDPQKKTAFVNRNASPAGVPPPPGAPAPGNAIPLTSKPIQSEQNPQPGALFSGRIASTSETTSPPPAINPKTTTKTEDLGSRVIDSLTVTGVRTTTTTSWVAGGEDKTKTAVNETWISPELQVIVERDIMDSAGTHHVSRLTNIIRTEPDAALFQIPSDYTVKEFNPRTSAVGSAH